MPDLFTDQKTPDIDPEKDYLSELVGEDKKFKDVSSLAKGKAQSDLFIEQLLSEAEEIRKELNTRINMESVLSELKTLDKKEPDDEPDHSDESKGVAPKDLEALLDKRLQEKLQEQQTQSKTKQNEELVASELTKLYGSEENANSEIRKKARELDTSLEDMKRMAQTSPKVFLQLFSVKKPDSFEPMKSSVSMPKSYSPSGHRTKAYWDKMKKENPSQYFSKEAMIERHQDALRAGEAFFDT